MKSKEQRQRAKAGFTLLELLLVIIILASVGFMVMSSVDNNVSQVRYADTQNRLAAIRTAILGPSSAILLERGVLTGFVADNGCLPTCMDDLVFNAVHENFISVIPIFDPDPDGDGFNDGFNEEIITYFPLMKGHRGGYLNGASNGKFMDGWGNPTNFITTSTNQGWKVDLGDNGFSVTSLGMDGLEGTFSADTPSTTYQYEDDLEMAPSVSAYDWQLNLAKATVKIRNQSINDITNNITVRAALLIYDASHVGNPWLTLLSEPQTMTSLDNGDGKTNGVSWSASTSMTVQFDSSVTNIPMGEHLLVLTYSNTLTSTYTTDFSALTNASPATMTWPDSSINVAQRVKFYPRSGVPDLSLEIR